MLMRTIIIPMYIIGLSYVTYSNLLLLTKAESLFCKLRCLPQLSQEYSTAPSPSLVHTMAPLSTRDYLMAYSHT